MPDVFISYRRSERAAVERIATTLRALGFSVWFDASMSAGETFNAEIDREARGAKAILICWSPGARASQWVNAEALIGFTSQKLAACYVAGPDEFDPPAPFNAIHAEDLRAWLGAPSETHAGWKSILRRLGKLCARADIESYGALDVQANAAELSAWIRQHQTSPLFVTVEALLATREAEEAERGRLEREARERYAREEAARRAREEEARRERERDEYHEKIAGLAHDEEARALHERARQTAQSRLEVVDKKLKTEGRRRQGWALSGGAAALAFIAVLVWQPWRPGALVPNANNTQTPGTGASTCEAHPQACDFARAVLASTEDVWAAQFQQGRLPDYGERPGAYQDPTLVVFSGTIATGCGSANSDAGPFYCPADLRLYVDPNFYEIVATRLNAPGDFVQAYMIAHEVGHHVQNLIGATLRQAPGETANQTSVRVELQADCLAGVWSHTASAALLLDDADLREALDAAHNTLGESHEQPRGSSAQRTRWFRRGFGTGDARQCDSFALPYAQL